jgi:hypothetical protein
MRPIHPQHGIKSSALPCSDNFNNDTTTSETMFPDSEADLTVFVDDLTQQMVSKQGVVVGETQKMVRLRAPSPLRHNRLRRGCEGGGERGIGATKAVAL